MNFIQIINKVRANESISHEELDVLLSWLLSDKGKSEFLTTLEEEWDSFETDKTFDYEELLGRVKQRIKESTPLRVRRTGFKYIRYAVEIAAVVVLAVGLAFFMRPSAEQVVKPFPVHDEVVEIYNPKGLRTAIILPDSSKVTLNADSKITYLRRFADDNRTVTIEGEAYFEVSKDSTRPFIVQAHQAKMVVLGTTFNVRSYDDEQYIETTLIEGSLKVDVGATEELLVPGKRISINKKSQKSIIQEVNTHNTIGWMNGKLYFHSLAFPEIANILERAYNVNIEVANSTLRQKKFSGKFENGENIGQILEVIKLSVHFTSVYDKRTNTIVIY